MHDDLKRFRAPRHRLAWIGFGLFFLIVYGLAGEDSYRLAKESEAARPVAQMVRASGKSAVAEDTEGHGFESHLAALSHPLGCGTYIAQKTFYAEPWRSYQVCAERK